MSFIVSSIFRDSADYIDRWVDQVSTLQRLAETNVYAIVAEGDSTDGTPELLAKALADADFDAEILTVNHGGDKYGSFDILERWRQIALVCNKVMDRVRREITVDDRFLYVESDLVWVPDDLVELVADLDTFGAVAPLSLQPNGDFYDVWGYRKNGIKFRHAKPFHDELGSGRYVMIDSSGSCFALRRALLWQVLFSAEDCILGIGRGISQAGESLWLDKKVSVIHPMETS